MKTLGIIIAALVLARTVMAGEPGTHFAASAMFMSNSSQQGGQGPSGSTLLTHSDLVYLGPWWGLGTFFQFDKQGDSETDTALGPKIELLHSVFYLEGGWAPLMNRAYTDRTIAKQTGSAFIAGLGVRIHFPSRLFLQFSYKYRAQIVKKQDGVELSERIYQRDGYPLFGLGYRF
jgi:hypothetical protein